jgi:hypothetical protein
MPSSNVTNLLGQKWEFVDVNKPVKEQDAATRTRVRVGAMRAFRRRQRLQQLEVFQSTQSSVSLPATKSQLPSTYILRNPRDPESELGQSSSHVVLDQASTTCTDLVQPMEQSDFHEGLRTLDPSGTRSIGLSQEQHYLLNHCK